MENQHTTPAETMHYGIAIDSGETSGWKIAGKSSNISEDEAIKLKEISSVGNISEAWADTFKKGYGYFGIFNQSALFVHYYRSSIPTPRGRHFVPWDIALVPWLNYTGPMNCDPGIVFASFPSPENRVFKNLDLEHPIETIQPLEIPLQQRSLAIQLEPLKSKQIPPDFIADFLTCVLQPNSKGTIIWWPESDPKLLVALLALIPPVLRKSITFCTCVADPRESFTRIKVVNVPITSEDHSFIIIKDEELSVNQKRIDIETGLPAILVDYYLKGIETLDGLHRYIDSSFTELRDLEDSLLLCRVETMASGYNWQQQIHIAKNTCQKFKQLLQYLQKEPDDKAFVVGELMEGLPGIFDGDVNETLQEFKMLLQTLSPLDETTIAALTAFVFNVEKDWGMEQFMKLLPVLSSVEDLNVSIHSVLFERLSLKATTPGWNTIFELLKLVENSGQIRQLEQNRELYEAVKRLNEGQIMLSLLKIIYSNTNEVINLPESSRSIAESIGNISNGRITADILLHFFKMVASGHVGKKGIIILLAAADTYAYESFHNYFKEIKPYFEELLITYFFSLKIDEASGEDFDNYDLIIKKIAGVTPGYAEKLESLTNQCALINSFRRSKRLMDEGIQIAFNESRAVEMFQTVDGIIAKIGIDRGTRENIFQGILQDNRELALNLYKGYLDYLCQRDHWVENDLLLLYNALRLNRRPLKNLFFFRKILSTILEKGVTGTRRKMLPEILEIMGELVEAEQLTSSEFISGFISVLRNQWNDPTPAEVQRIYEATGAWFGKTAAKTVLEIGLSKLTDGQRAVYSLSVIKQFYDVFSLVFEDRISGFKQLADAVENARQENDSLVNEVQDLLQEIRDKKNLFKKIEKTVKKINKL